MERYANWKRKNISENQLNILSAVGCEKTYESNLARYLAKSYQEARTYKIMQDDRLSKILQEHLASSYKYPQDLKLARSSK
jgi:hypothetical protein